MRNLLSKLLLGLVGLEVIAGVVLGFLVYFVRTVDRATGQPLDGLGRPLEFTPFMARFIFGADSLWPGWSYFALDMVVFWIGIGVGFGLVNLATKLEKSNGA